MTAISFSISWSWDSGARSGAGSECGRAAEGKGIPNRVEFFGEATSRSQVAEGCAADLIVGNNVLAQVPDLNGFVAGIEARPRWHQRERRRSSSRTWSEPSTETSSTPSITSTSPTSHSVRGANPDAQHGLIVFDVEELPSHGGSLRIYAWHGRHAAEPSRRASRPSSQRRRRRGCADPWRTTDVRPRV